MAQRSRTRQRTPQQPAPATENTDVEVNQPAEEPVTAEEQEFSKELVVVGTPDSEKPKGKRRVYVATPFQITRAVNNAFVRLGIDKTIPPQMLYSYRAQGKFKSTKSADGRWEVDRDSFVAWFETYLQKLQRRLAKRAAQEANKAA